MTGKTIRLAVALGSLSLLWTVMAGAQDTPLPIDPAKYPGSIKVACVGDSITEGVGAGAGNSWPEQLGRMLGDKWDVRNFGVSGTTLMRSGDKPYQKQDAFARAKAFNPDVVVIMLGTNDTRPWNWKKFKTDFEADLIDMVNQFAALAGKPRIFVCYPPYIAKGGKYRISEGNTLEEIPVISKVAAEMKLGVIDVHGSLKGKDELIPDNVHPNRAGAGVIADAVFKVLIGKDAPGTEPVNK